MKYQLATEETLCSIVAGREASDLLGTITETRYAIPAYVQDVPRWFSIARTDALFVLTFHDEATNEPIGFAGVWEIHRPAGSLDVYLDLNDQHPNRQAEALQIISDLCRRHYWFKQLYYWTPLTAGLEQAMEGTGWSLEARLPQKIKSETGWIDQGLLAFSGC